MAKGEKIKSWMLLVLRKTAVIREKIKSWMLKILRKAYHSPAVVLGVAIGTFIGTLIVSWVGMIICLLVLVGFAVNDMNKE